jgi:predicted amidohydrolase
MLSMTNDLRVTLVQTDLQWHKPQANLSHLENKLASFTGQTDLVVLPEMFTSGFTAHPENIDGDSKAVGWLLHQSEQLDAAIVGSVAWKLDKHENRYSRREIESTPDFVNRLIFARPDNSYDYYDKVHLFRMADEHKRYQPGRIRSVVEFREWRFLLTVCYDLRFPAFCRNQLIDNNYEYDAILCVANWPSARRHHWRTLLQARAIENQSYMIGVNRVGVDGKQLHYSGDSLLIDAKGDILLDQEGEWVNTSVLSRKDLEQYRQEFPVWQDADQLSLTIHK